MIVCSTTVGTLTKIYAANMPVDHGILHQCSTEKKCWQISIEAKCLPSRNSTKKSCYTPTVEHSLVHTVPAITNIHILQVFVCN